MRARFFKGSGVPTQGTRALVFEHPRKVRAALALLGLTAATACSPTSKLVNDGTWPPAGYVPITITSVDTTFVTMNHMMASLEMQISGEPLAQAMGRILTGYSRDYPAPNLYFDPADNAKPILDLPGFSTGVESYEYSKQPMNNLAFESGAGTSLAFGPVLNPTAATGADALAILRARVQHFAIGSNAANTYVSPTATAENPLGWPGIWPTIHPFRSFDPHIQPTSSFALQCSITSDDDPGAHAGTLNEDYECDATSLHLPDREAQVDKTVTPGSSGFEAWKMSLWVINYLGSMHDAAETAITAVPAADLAVVGTAGNTVQATSPGAPASVPGAFLGSSNIEGFQAQMMIEGLDNEAQEWLSSLSTTDGVTLTGFPTLMDALAYGYDSPLRWFPAELAVHETRDASGFPRQSFSLQSSDSKLLEQLGLAGGFAGLYALTDHANANIGGTQAVLAYFDGDPFPSDDQLANGQPTPHDRWLAMLRVLTVNIDRLHRDPSSGLLVDTVTFAGGVPTRGTTIDTVSVAYTMLALRQVRRALASQLALYSNRTPDALILSTPLDSSPLSGAPDGATTVAERLSTLLQAHADLLYDHLTDASGAALPGWNVATGAPTSTDDTLDAHAAAIKGLFAGYLATSNTKYRDRAIAVLTRMNTVFYMDAPRIYTTSPAPATDVAFTPVRFALLQSALRDAYELYGVHAGQGALAARLEERIERLNKLVLNGWDDALPRNQLVEWPAECLQYSDLIPRGGLQMGERALSGELGSDCDQVDCGHAPDVEFDRDDDCVPEIGAAQLPSALASQVVFHIGN